MEMTKEIEPFIDAIAERVAVKVLEKLGNPCEYAYSGIEGIMQIFHCSRSKAQELKNSHILDPAIVSHGRKFVIDKQKALACLAEM